MVVSLYCRIFVSDKNKQMNIETRYFNLKNDITDDLRGFILNPGTLLQRHRQGDRLHDTFAGVIAEPYRGSWYTVTIYLSDWFTKEKLQTKLYVDRNFNIINDKTVSA